MAVSSSHRLGQYIGNFIEFCFTPLLDNFCKENSLYLDVVGKSRPARKGKKVSWVDFYGNEHDLDFVIELNGTDSQIGRPLAFIESAWRRYTKHSKNKAQEIQGAILPIVESHRIECPFKGAILAGCFTGPSLIQLKESGFEVLYIEYQDIINSFLHIGMDVNFDEKTSNDELLMKANAAALITDVDWCKARKYLLSKCEFQIKTFIQSLSLKLNKIIKNIIVTPTYGCSFSFKTINEAIYFIRAHDSKGENLQYNFIGFIVMVEYINKDIVKGEFSSSVQAENFLKLVINME